MDKGWIKLHRRILDNPGLSHDTTARYMFIMFMLIVDQDTGSWSGGRKQLAAITGFNEHTIRKAIERLEGYEMVTRMLHPRYTTYSICNWSRYQSKVTPSLHGYDHSNKNKKENKKNLLNTLQESRGNRAHFLSLTDFSEYETKFPTKNVSLEHEKAVNYLKSTGKQYKDYQAFFGNWLHRSDDKPSKRPMLVIGRKS